MKKVSISVRAEPEEKAAWQREAGDIPLERWIRRTLNLASSGSGSAPLPRTESGPSPEEASESGPPPTARPRTTRSSTSTPARPVESFERQIRPDFKGGKR
jgi:hypothetical protein